MAGQMGGGCSNGGRIRSSEENGGPDFQNERKNYHRHTPEQIQRLEAFYKECPLPDENQRRELGLELSLEPRQIKFWFQNKRVQTKIRDEQEENNVLRVENDRIRRENIAIQEVLKGMTCPSCSPPLGEEETKQTREELQRENLQLRQEFERISNILANHMGRPILEPVFNQAGVGPAGQGSRSPDFEIGSLVGNLNFDKSLMTEIAASAMYELIKLLRLDNPLWIRSPVDERHVLDHECYAKIIPQSMGPRFLKSRVESSKHTGLVNMDARQLVDLYLDLDHSCTRTWIFGDPKWLLSADIRANAYSLATDPTTRILCSSLLSTN